MNLKSKQEISKLKSSINILKTRIIRNIAQRKTTKVDEKLFSRMTKNKKNDPIETFNQMKEFESSSFMQTNFAKKNIGGWIKKQTFNLWKRIK